MSVTFEPHTRLEHLEDYVGKIHLNLPPNEARVQLLRCRIVAWGLIAEIMEERYDRRYVDQLFSQAYQALSTAAGREIADPYQDPCASQYLILDELRSYSQRDPSEPFMRFIRAEFKKVFVPTLRLMTDLCLSANKYSWQDVKAQLQEVIRVLRIDVTWEECEERLDRYMNKVGRVMGIESGPAKSPEETGAWKEQMIR